MLKWLIDLKYLAENKFYLIRDGQLTIQWQELYFIRRPHTYKGCTENQSSICSMAYRVLELQVMKKVISWTSAEFGGPHIGRCCKESLVVILLWPNYKLHIWLGVTKLTIIWQRWEDNLYALNQINYVISIKIQHSFMDF